MTTLNKELTEEKKASAKERMKRVLLAWDKDSPLCPLCESRMIKWKPGDYAYYKCICGRAPIFHEDYEAWIAANKE